MGLTLSEYGALRAGELHIGYADGHGFVDTTMLERLSALPYGRADMGCS
jgi:hypothetical protein